MIEHTLGEDRAMSGMGRGIVLRQIERLFRDGTLGGLGDGQLLDRYRMRRDETAFEALVDLHGPMVLGLCRRMLRDPRDIEDAFQATFLVLVRKAPAIRDGNLLSSWLYGVAYRVARRARSQTLRRRGHEAPVGELEVAARPESTDRSEIDPVLDQELNRLPEKYRAPLILCYLRGQSHDQAAEELRCPVGTVRSRLARGRDLLKKRLTRRGFSPSATAAILGTGHGLPATLRIEVVPPSLISATVRAGLGFGSTQTIGAGAIAATALALAQGVLTTMKLAQLKWIGLAVLATALSAGGVVAVTFASTKVSGTWGSEPTVVNSIDPTESSGPQSRDRDAGTQPVSGPTETATKEIERKIDQLLKEIGYFASDGSLGGPAGDGSLAGKILQRKLGPLLTPRAATAVAPANAPGDDPFRLTSPPARPDPETRGTVPASTNSVRELEVRLQLALAAFDRTESLFRNNAVPFNVREEARGRVLVIAAQLEGLDEDLADEIARLKVELRRKQAGREKAQAQAEVSQVSVARNKRLHEQKLVVPEEVAKAEAEYKVANAGVRIVDVEIEEVRLQIERSERRQKSIRRVLAMAHQAKAAVPAK